MLSRSGNFTASCRTPCLTLLNLDFVPRKYVTFIGIGGWLPMFLDGVAAVMLFSSLLQWTTGIVSYEVLVPEWVTRLVTRRWSDIHVDQGNVRGAQCYGYRLFFYRGQQCCWIRPFSIKYWIILPYDAVGVLILVCDVSLGS